MASPAHIQPYTARRKAVARSAVAILLTPNAVAGVLSKFSTGSSSVLFSLEESRADVGGGL